MLEQQELPPQLRTQVRSPTGSPVTVQLRVAPDTVAVAQPFAVDIAVRTPANAQLLWPTPADSLAPIALRGAVESLGIDRDGVTTVRYPVAAWDTGQVAVSWSPLLVVQGNDTLRIDVPPVRVTVRSILPSDTTLHVPKPPKGVIADPLPWWPWVLGTVIALLGLWWWRRYRARGAAVTRRDARSPYQLLCVAFDQASRGVLASPAESARVVALSAGAFRTFLFRMLGLEESWSAAECATVLQTLVRRGEIQPEIAERVTHILAHADVAMYSAEPVIGSDQQQLVRTMRSIAEQMDAKRMQESP